MDRQEIDKFLLILFSYAFSSCNFAYVLLY